MDAVISDFDGVIADSEPIHLVCFQQVLAERGVVLTSEDYYGKYLGVDDHDCLAAAGADHGRNFSELELSTMTAAKTLLVQQAMRERIAALPGVVDLVGALSEAGVPLAVCSGALLDEIELASTTIGVRDAFKLIVSADDVQHGKPDPEGYQLAMARLGEATGKALDPAKCVVLEDSPAGIEAAKAAGMKVLAVTTSYPAGALQAADRIVASLEKVTPDDLAAMAR
ncbi:MAG: HAD family hydrolase [Planctomycetota bacterium]